MTNKRLNMKIKKLYPVEWVKLHPYKHADRIDQYYTKLANRVYVELIESPLVEKIKEDEKLRHIALCLTAWFEDIVSETGIWQAFTTECKKRYGSYLPFYNIEDDYYYPEEINMEDIRFLLWHYTQQESRGESIINPENPGIAMIAQKIYEIFDEEYETAPENERMQDLLCYPEKFDEGNFYPFRELMEWFHYDSYFNVSNLSELRDMGEKLVEEINYHTNKEFLRENINVLMYSSRIDLIMNGRRSHLSLTTPEWFARLWACGDNAELFRNISTRRNCKLLYEKDDENFVFVKDLEREDEIIRINKASLDLKKRDTYLSGKTLFICSLVYFGNSWWQYGMLLQDEFNAEVKKEIDIEKIEKQGDEGLYKRFIKASKGKPVMFCKTKEELKKFLSTKMKLELGDGVQFNSHELNESDGIIVSVLPETDIYMQASMSSCIKSADNPMYYKEEADKNTILFVVNPAVVPYKFSCLLQDHGMLVDARINTLEGGEYGREFFQKNIQFFTDYFHNRCREKDYSK